MKDGPKPQISQMPQIESDYLRNLRNLRFPLGLIRVHPW
jgi:hypothetical protein